MGVTGTLARGQSKMDVIILTIIGTLLLVFGTYGLFVLRMSLDHYNYNNGQVIYNNNEQWIYNWPILIFIYILYYL